MDRDKLKRRQSLKVIISEAIMVLAVIITVIILAFIVSGYWLNSDFKVERQGLVQIYSVPTGADVNIDGEPSSWLQRTNTSKTLTSGEHTITLSKEGYDSWTKTINLKEGLLYRLHYPRLFLIDRLSTKVLDANTATLATISPDFSDMVLINSTTKWSLVNLENDTLEPKNFSIAEYFSDVSVAEGATTGLFSGKIVDLNWDADGNHILFEIEGESTKEWVLIDVRNIKNSINLSKEFGADFSNVEILDNSSNNLLAVQNGNLHKIDVSGKSISTVLVENVIDFDHYNNTVLFSAESKDSDYYLGTFKVGDNQITELETFSQPFRVAIVKFYDETYYATICNQVVSLYKESPEFTKVSDYELSFVPDHRKVGQAGEFIIMYFGDRIATLDMEASDVREWTIENDNFGWLVNDMIYTVSDGELIAYDFDGYNRRVLAKNVSSHFPAAITNNKWLYYFSDDTLIREQVAK